MTIPFQRPNTFGEAKFYKYKINQSCRFNDDDSAHLQRTNPGTRTSGTLLTISVWLKRCNITVGGSKMPILDGGSGANDATVLAIDANDRLQIKHKDGGSTNFQYLSTQVFRDITSWYHIFVKYDSTDATAGDRIRVWVNNVEINDWDTEDNPSSNKTHDWTKTSEFVRIGRGRLDDSTYYSDFYLSEFHVIDGQALTPSSFGESKYGIWIPKRYTGTYGLAGFYLDIADSADLGKDISGNGGDFASSGLTSDDQVIDSPTNNYCVMNNLLKDPGSLSFADGNLHLNSGSAGYENGIGTFACLNKTYFEVNSEDANGKGVGVSQLDADFTTYTSTGKAFLRHDGKIQVNGSEIETGLATIGNGDIVGVAVNLTSNKIWFAVNNTWVDGGDPAAGTDGYDISALTEDLFPLVLDLSNSSLINVLSNFGQLDFTYTPPTGFKALCSNNLPNPSIKDSSKGFDTVLWEGNATVRNITNLNFMASNGSLVWIKNRDQADEHKLIDTVRGATKELSSDSDVIEGTDADGLTAFLSNGFSLGTGATGYNDNGENFVAWCFREGIKYGFDIVPYIGTGSAQAINHNLGGVPELMIVKSKDVVRYWRVYHHHAANKTDPETDYGELNSSDSWSDSNLIWNDTAPTSTQFTVGTSQNVNENTKYFITYLWKSVEGFSKVYSYTGNGNADGPFVYCGFRPRYLLLKKASGSTESWVIHDSERDIFNPVSTRLRPDLPNAELTGTNFIDFTSSGFKIRTTSLMWNSNTITYIGIAIAEQPGKWANAR